MNNNEDLVLNVLEKDFSFTNVKEEAKEINYKDVDVVINVPTGN